MIRQRLVIGTVVLLGLFAHPSVAQQRPAAAPHPLLTLERQLALAAARRDAAELQRLLAPDFTQHSAAGRVVSRVEWLRGTLHELVTDSVQVADARVVLASDDSAVVTLRDRWFSRVHGRPMRVRAHDVRDVWRRRGDEWQLVRRTATPSGATSAPDTLFHERRPPGVPPE